MKSIIRLSCFISMVLIAFLAAPPSRAGSAPECVALFYAKSPPDEALYFYDWLIVDPDTFSMERLRERSYMGERRARLFAYVSVAERGPHRDHFKDVKREWVLGENRAWGSLVVDLRNPAYRRFLVDSVITPIVKQGYDGLFLDTLDSYRLVLEKGDWKGYEEAEVLFISKLKERFPGIMIIVNRGFEIMDSIHRHVDGVLAEGLFHGLDTEAMDYREMDGEETRWLTERLRKVKEYGLPVIVVDYVSPGNRGLQRDVARRISELGFLSYISDYNLSTMGTGNCEPVPRRILLFYNSDRQKEESLTDIHRFVQLPLEYLGFVPELRDVKKGPPWDYMTGAYAGAVIWTGGLDDYHEFHQWITERIEEGLKVFFLDGFGFPANKRLLAPLGINILKAGEKRLWPFKIKKSILPFFEVSPSVDPTVPRLSPEEGTPLLVVEDENGDESVPFALTPWGGYALDGALIVKGFDAWAYDPFEVFKTVFGPVTTPVPDVTTENGRRILTAHIDGDSFFGYADFDRKRLIGEVIRDEILKRFVVPHTVAVIEGEVAPWGLYPERSARLEEVARSIFAMENVEAASHSYSHPFVWKALRSGTEASTGKRYKLPLPGYRFDLEREIKGSTEYINTRLIPEGKRIKVFLWTGDCQPPEDAVKMTYRLGIYNVNGGDTQITRSRPFLFFVSPMGVNRGRYFQVYAPVQNENLYTGLWTGPYYGYSNVIQTFELTERPRRLKPIGIYYHFYSGQKIASLRALKKVYAWALSQETNPMFLSEYAARVHGFRDMAVGRINGELAARDGGRMKTLKIEKGRGYPDPVRSRGVVGYREAGEVIYIHLDGSGDYRVTFTDKRRPGFRLIEANGQVVFHNKGKGQVSIGLKGYLPLEFAVEESGCEVHVKGGGFERRKKKGAVTVYRFKDANEAVIRARCKGQVF